ncbi:MAG TPA: response regulator transcription factor [Sphingobacteriaceae bacterium]
MSKRVLIADDHGATRKGLRSILQREFPQFHFAEAESAQQTIHLLQNDRWHILILDVEMQGRNGFDVLKQIATENLKTPVLIFSYHNEERMAVRCFRSGASGYLTKEADDAQIIHAVRQVLSGEKYISGTVAQFLATYLTTSEKEPHERLTDREYQILILIASGKTYAEISALLSLSISTISTYRTRILEKMEMRTNAELTNYAIRMNLL